MHVCKHFQRDLASVVCHAIYALFCNKGVKLHKAKRDKCGNTNAGNIESTDAQNSFFFFSIINVICAKRGRNNKQNSTMNRHTCSRQNFGLYQKHLRIMRKTNGFMLLDFKRRQDIVRNSRHRGENPR